MALTSGTVLLQAAAHLNDINQLVYTSAVLLPFLNMGIQELEEEIAVYNLTPLKRNSIPIDVPLGSLQLPQMPVDFVEAIALYERADGSSDRWREVREVVDIDKNLAVNTDPQILEWTVRGAFIMINPPSSNREIQLEYLAGLAVSAGVGTAIDIDSSRRYLALLTARNAARDLGNAPTKAETWKEDITTAKDRLIRRILLNTQETYGVRRRPYTGRS